MHPRTVHGAPGRGRRFQRPTDASAEPARLMNSLLASGDQRVASASIVVDGASIIVHAEVGEDLGERPLRLGEEILVSHEMRSLRARLASRPAACRRSSAHVDKPLLVGLLPCRDPRARTPRLPL